MENPDLSIIIVAFRGYQRLRDTVNSVLNSRFSYSYEVIVVDNGSGDETPDSFLRDFPEEKYPQITLLRNQNNGFAQGNNLGVQHSNGKYILILNPDTELFKDALQKCMSYIISNETTGALGCKLINADGKLDPACRRSFPNLANSIYRFTGLQKLFPKSKKFGSYNLTYLPDDQIIEVDSLVGAFMLLPRSVFDQVGGFDQEYFMYGEDLDLCYKIKQAGYKVVYYPDAVTYHYKGQSSRKTPYRMLYEFHKSMWIFYEKHYMDDHTFLMNSLVFTGIWLRYGIKFIQNFFRQNKYVSKI